MKNRIARAVAVFAVVALAAVALAGIASAGKPSGPTVSKGKAKKYTLVVSSASVDTTACGGLDVLMSPDPTLYTEVCFEGGAGGLLPGPVVWAVVNEVDPNTGKPIPGSPSQFDLANFMLPLDQGGDYGYTGYYLYAPV